LDRDETPKPPKLIGVAVAGRTSADAAGSGGRLGDGRRSIAVPAGFESDEFAPPDGGAGVMLTFAGDRILVAGATA
jgi:hypothetical protein